MNIFDDILNNNKYNNNSFYDPHAEIQDALQYHAIQKEIEDEKSNSKYDRETYINRKLIFSNQYERSILSLGENKECTRLILEAARTMTKHHHGDKYEDLYFIDCVTNISLAQTEYRVREHEVLPTKAMKELANDNPNIISIHNHPTNGLPSLSDLNSCSKIGYKYGLVICHNGSIYKYKTRKEYNNINSEIALNIFTKEELLLAGLAFDKETFKNKHKENISELKNNLSDAGIEFTEVLWYAD